MDSLIAPSPRLPHPLSPSSSSCPSPCPSTPRSILRQKCRKEAAAANTCVPCHVRFSEAIDEHFADDYDRCPCAVATPSFREIRELERIRRELCPNGQGISDQDDDNYDVGEICFDFDGSGDCDDAISRRPKPKRRLRGVPIELCPILPTPTAAPTPFNSKEHSPLNSPPLGPSPLGGSCTSSPANRPPPSRVRMQFMPILPPSDPPTPAGSAIPSPQVAPIPTPPETPTLLKLELSDDTPSAPHPNPSITLTTTHAPYGLPQHHTRPPPTTCRMAIMPVLASSSPRQYGPVVAPPPQPFPMMFKAARS